MKDIKSFCKLFDLNVPSYVDFDYYKNIYARLDRWKNMDELISLYEKAEEQIEDIYKYRLEKTEEIINFIKTTRAFNDLNDDTMIPDLPTNKNFEYSEGVKYLSIDIKMANWESLKKYDPSFVNELGDTYSDLLNKFNVPEVFHRSKQLRQYIFGNLNPKRQIKAQRVMVEDLMNGLSRYNLKVECIKTDEVVYSFENIADIADILLNFDDSIFRCKVFTVRRIDNFRINDYIDVKRGLIHSEPLGCNGHKYFINLKKYVFYEELDVRDLYFRMDGDLAIWNIEGLKLEL
jgi:hypothetical protein